MQQATIRGLSHLRRRQVRQANVKGAVTSLPIIFAVPGPAHKRRTENGVAGLQTVAQVAKSIDKVGTRDGYITLCRDASVRCCRNFGRNWRELSETRWRIDILGRSHPSSGRYGGGRDLIRAAHRTLHPKGSSIQWTPHAVELVLVLPLRQLDWHREDAGRGGERARVWWCFESNGE